MNDQIAVFSDVTDAISVLSDMDMAYLENMETDSMCIDRIFLNKSTEIDKAHGEKYGYTVNF